MKHILAEMDQDVHNAAIQWLHSSWIYLLLLHMHVVHPPPPYHKAATCLIPLSVNPSHPVPLADTDTAPKLHQWEDAMQLTLSHPWPLLPKDTKKVYHDPAVVGSFLVTIGLFLL